MKEEDVRGMHSSHLSHQVAAEITAPLLPHPMLIPCQRERLNDQVGEFGLMPFPALSHLSACKESAFRPASTVRCVKWGRRCPLKERLPVAGSSCVQVRHLSEGRRVGSHVQLQLKPLDSHVELVFNTHLPGD